MKRMVILALALVFLATALPADVYIKTINHVDPINAMGQSFPARDTVSEQWISDDFYYLDTGEGFSYLYDIKKNIIYLISHRTKSYLEIKPPADFSSLLPPELAPMAQALEQMTMSVRPTEETRVVNNIKCQGYRLEMTMMMYPIEMNIWASEELPVNLKKFLETVWPEINKLEFKVSSQAYSELAKIKGLWIASETRAQMTGVEVTSRSEVSEISKKTPPKGIYTLPANYRKKDRLEMEDIQGF
ncbi:MAG: hypothetical protein NUW07_05990 [Candidatus Saccharicenans sp.]|jgi:hypothetical protein|nr:hypothetical protein [Candidatus Saccharicenans sp.]MDH7492339.1 hypothetical protein [Candidatus Saccharicenans sp.]